MKSNEILKRLLTHEARPAFVLVQGAPDLGKRQLVLDVVNDHLKEAVHYDLLHVKDMSKYLGKYHSLQNKTPSTLRTIPFDNDKNYINYGADDIRQRIARSSGSGQKIVIIENIERATITASNSLLKELEEPAPGVLVIATTSHPDGVLSTLHSRAYHLRIPSISNEQLSDIARQANIQEEYIAGMVCLSAGKPQRMRQLIDTDDRDIFLTGLRQLTDLTQEHHSLAQCMSIYNTTLDTDYMDRYLDALMMRSVDHHKFHITDAVIHYRQHLSAHVHVENAKLILAMTMQTTN